MTPFEAPKKLRSEKLQSSEDDARGASQGFAAVLLAHVSFKSFASFGRYTYVLRLARKRTSSCPVGMSCQKAPFGSSLGISGSPR